MKADELGTTLGQVEEQLGLYASLKEHKLFKEYFATLQQQIRVRREEYETVAPKGLDDLVVNEFLRGQISGLSLAMAFFTSAEESNQEAQGLLQEALRQQAETEEGEGNG